MSTLTYNSVDLSTYNMVITTAEVDILQQIVKTANLPTRAYGWKGEREPREIDLDFTVTGSSISNLLSNLDNVKRVILNQDTPAQLIFSIQSSRYFMAVPTNFNGRVLGTKMYKGIVRFRCADQNAYSTSEDQNDHNIDADPDTVSEVAGGTAPAYPVYKLTAGETLTDKTVKIKNNNTGQEIEWVGSLVSTDYLEFDCVRWTVSKNGTASMATADGEFPYLEGGASNSITVTNFGTTGTLRITYRDRYF